MRAILGRIRPTASERWYRLAVIGTFIVAALLRISATRQELPPFQFCDESIFSSEAERMVLSHDWVTHEFRSGGLNIYPMVLVGRVLTHFGVFSETSFVVAGRWLYAVVLASAAVFFVAGAARVLSGRRAIGLTAAVLFLLSPSLLAVSRYWYPDHYSVVFSSALVYLLVLYLRRRPSGRARVLLIVGIGVVLGGALAVKYTFSIAALPVALAFASEIRFFEGSPVRRAGRFVRELGLAAVVSVVVAVVLNFSALIDPAGFRYGFVFNIQNYSRPGGSPTGILFYAFLLFVASLGLVGIAGFVAGAVALWRSARPTLIVLLCFPLVNVGYLGLQGLVFNRNIVSSIPFLLPVIAVGIGRLVLVHRGRTVRAGLAVALVSVGAVLQVVQVGANVVTDLAPDSEPIATTWVAQHVPKTTVVGVNGTCSASTAQVAGLSVQQDPQMAARLPYYVINSYWESALNGAFRGPSVAWAILDQKYLHYYYPSDRDLPFDVFALPWHSVTPQQAAPAGYTVVKVFQSNGPSIVVLKREG